MQAETVDGNDVFAVDEATADDGGAAAQRRRADAPACRHLSHVGPPRHRPGPPTASRRRWRGTQRSTRSSAAPHGSRITGSTTQAIEAERRSVAEHIAEAVRAAECRALSRHRGASRDVQDLGAPRMARMTYAEAARLALARGDGARPDRLGARRRPRARGRRGRPVQGPAGGVRARPDRRHADLRIDDHGVGGGRGGRRHAAGRGAALLRFRPLRRRRDRQPGRQGALHDRRAGARAAGDPPADRHPCRARRAALAVDRGDLGAHTRASSWSPRPPRPTTGPSSRRRSEPTTRSSTWSTRSSGPSKATCRRKRRSPSSARPPSGGAART